MLLGGNSNLISFLFSGHCKKLAPDYSTAAKKLAKNKPKYFLAKVDATQSKKLAERFEVKGFPTILYFKYHLHPYL
jgi:thioredoxin-like negative regulator of GroEL